VLKSLLSIFQTLAREREREEGREGEGEGGRGCVDDQYEPPAMEAEWRNPESHGK
jgi:hypothetical protein